MGVSALHVRRSSAAIAGSVRSGSHARVAALVVAAAAGYGMLSAPNPVSADTFQWTRAANNNNWDNRTNWLSGGLLVAPPQAVPAGNTTDIVFSGTSTTVGTTSALRQDYSISSLTIATNFSHGSGTSTLSISTASVLLAPATSAHLTIGSGGIAVGQVPFNINLTRNSSAQAADLIVNANQTWQIDNTTTNTTGGVYTVTITRPIVGTGNVVKTGDGTVVIANVLPNSSWNGIIDINGGNLRTGGLASDHNGHFGTSVLRSVSALTGSITASTVNSAGGERRFDNDLILGGTGRLNFGGSFNLGFSANSEWQLVGDKQIGAGFVTDHLGTITGNFGWSKYGGGMVVLNNTSTYLGATTVSEGVLRVRNATALGSGTAGVTVQAADGVTNALGGSLEIDAVSVSGKPLMIAGNGLVSATPPSGVTSNGGAVRNLSGNNTWSGPVTLAADATIRLETGSLAFPAGITGTTGGLSVITPNVAQLSTLRIRTGGTLSVGDQITASLTSTAKGVDTSRIGSLATTGSGKLDIRTSDLVIGSGDLAGVTAFVAGLKLISSVAGTVTADPRDAVAAVAVFSNNAGGGVPYYGSFGALPVTASDVLVMYTYRGDTNVDGKLDGTDLANLLEGLSLGLTGWQNGDLNYDGVVNATDLGLYNTALAAYGAPFVGGGTGGAGGGGAIPEPAALGLLAVAVPLVVRRRR